MGYYARGSGSVTFYEVKNDDGKLDEALDRIGEVFEDYQIGGDAESESGYIDFWMDEKYRGDAVTDLLDYLANSLCLIDGSVEFAGEDDTYWRYLYVKEKNGFICQNGRIVYE